MLIENQYKFSPLPSFYLFIGLRSKIFNKNSRTNTKGWMHALMKNYVNYKNQQLQYMKHFMNHMLIQSNPKHQNPQTLKKIPQIKYTKLASN